VSHQAIKLAAQAGALLVWIGEGGVGLYASGQLGGARSDRLLYQTKLALDDGLRLKIVRAMYVYRFKKEALERLSIKQLRGIEGAHVKSIYQMLAKQCGIVWHGRRYNPKDWKQGGTVNQCISTVTSYLYGVTETAVLAAGYASAIGFVYSGKPLSFVYDIADLIKFDGDYANCFSSSRAEASRS
jgi:CRISPR-associated protein Cas1